MEITEVIKQGHITEKSVLLQTTTTPTGAVVPRYTFTVALEANKHEIREAVERIFNVKVVRVNTVRMRGKPHQTRTRKGIYRSDARPWKKAIVTLAAGQSIAELQA
ncbi:MAG TPA: 50S ribosomal protein L23 [Ktedonobacterales bacterium]|jgi:large subunit ribosomal protein L23